MATKKDLWIRATSNQEWYELLKIKGLVLIEIFNSEYGPCVSMQNPLRNFRLMDLVEDQFHLATARADKIHVLERFRKTCEPIWFLVGCGKLITILFGCNAPVMFKIIRAEFQKEQKVLEGSMTRPYRSWTEVTLEEIARDKESEEMHQMMQAEKDRQLADRKENYRLQSLESIKELLADKTIVLFFNNGRTSTGEYPCMQKLSQHYEKLNLVEETLEDVQLTDEKIRHIFCKSAFVISDRLRENMVRCVSCILRYEPPQETEDKLPLGEIETRLAAVVYGLQDDGTIDVNKPRNSSVVGTTYVMFSPDSSGGPPTNKERAVPVRLPTLWTPETVEAKCSAMHALYEYKLQTELDFVANELPPPQTILVFEARRSGGIERMLLKNADILHKYGYFTSYKPESNPRLVARDWSYMKKFDDYKIANSKLVAGLLEFDDDKLAEFLLTDPLYVSPDGDTGSHMAEMFFPPNFSELHEEEVPLRLPDDISMDSGENAEGEAEKPEVEE